MTDRASATSTAEVPTDRPNRYGKQLIAHLSRRSAGEWSDETGTGWITFDAGRAELNSSDGALLLRVAGDPDNVARLEDVVGRHLVRFGARDELVVSWVRDDGTPGTEQRKTED
ncbi:MAG: DUF2218 domain-containing protein [Jatrophihabitantaceae bacterium]